MMKKLTFEDVLQAREAIRPYVRQTPLEQSFYLGDAEHHFYFKLESLQRARSFKIRGAVNKMLSLTAEERACGVAAVSSGNHGSSVAYAAQLLGIEKAVIVVPETTPQSKVDKIRYFGAEVKLLGRNYDEAHALGMAYIHEHGLTNIDSCHDDVLVYAGQGTVALEILEQEPEIDTIVVPIGGGGIATGVALAAKTQGRGVQVYTIIGDGESQEGLVWEACMAAAHYKLDNLCIIIDNNGLQIDGDVAKVMSPYPIDAKLSAFGFDVTVDETIANATLQESYVTGFSANLAAGENTIIIRSPYRGGGNGNMHIRDILIVKQ